MNKMITKLHPIKLLFSILIASIFLLQGGQALASPSASLTPTAVTRVAPLPKIISISLPSLTLQQHEKYKLPVKVSVLLSNNTRKLMPIIWSSKAVYADTKTAGTITQYGTLAATGYTRQIKLTFKVVPYVVAVPELSFRVVQYDPYLLPQTIPLSYSDDMVRQGSVNWQETTASTSQEGTLLFHGTVDGWSKPVLLTLEVLPMKIISAVAENGDLLVQLSNPPAELPDASSFTVTASKLTPTSESSVLTVTSIAAEPSDTTNTKFKLRFPILNQGFDIKTYQLRIAYLDGPEFLSNTFAIPALTVASGNIDPKVADSQQFYKAVNYALENYLESIDLLVRNYSDKEYNLDMIDKVLYEHPEIDYSYYSSSSSIGRTGSDGYTPYLLKLKYKLSKEKMLEEKHASEQKATEVVARLIKPEMTDFQKELALHDYLVSTTEYDSRASNNLESVESHNSYGALILGVGVCESYAKALSLLFEKAGLTQRYVIGDATDNGKKVGHAWNMIRLDGEWYHVDATWNDPNSTSATARVRHEYFNLSDSMIFKDHFEDESHVDFPDATGTKYYFYNLRTTELDEKNTPMLYINSVEEYKTQLAKALSTRTTYIGFILLNCATISYDTERALEAVHTGAFRFQASMMQSNHPADPNIKFIEIQFTY